MYRGRYRGPEVRARILRGQQCWWFLGGEGAVARLQQSHLAPDGSLRPEAEQHLRQQGLLAEPVRRNYSLTVLSSSHCNLGCAYCFQNTGQDEGGGTRPPRIGASRLTSQTIAEIIEFTRERMAAAGLSRLLVMLFGGEPLLNPDGCRELLARSAGLGLHAASMISNGTLLTPALASELAGLGLRTIQITFDGDRDAHDQIRVRRRAGGETFDRIVDNVAAAIAAAPIAFALRVNVSHENHAGIDALVERLAERLPPSRCSIYFKLVGDIGIGFHNQLRLSDDLVSRFDRWHQRALELGFHIPRPRAHLPCSACSYQDGQYGAVVNADGVLASCWETAGWPQWQVGTVSEGYLPREQTADRWVSCEQRYLHADDVAGWEQFQDRVDAALLDQLAVAGRL